MAKGNGGTRTTGASGITPAPTAEQIFEGQVADAISAFDGLSPTRKSFEKDAQANIDNPIRIATAFSSARGSNAIKEGAMEGIGMMYDMYNIPRLKEVAFNGANRYSDEAAATSPDGKYMRFNTDNRSRNQAKEHAIHEMTHVMVGPDFQRISPSMAMQIRSIHGQARNDIKSTRNSYRDYWRTDPREFVSVAFQKALTGQSMNQYEKSVFLLIHNQFKKR